MKHRLTAVLLGLGLTAAGPAGATDEATLLRPGTDLVVHPFHPATPPARPAALARTAASRDLDAQALRQIGALQAEKAARTPAQAKIDARHLYTARMLLGQPAAPGVAALETGVELDAADALVSELTAEVSDALLARLKAAGVKVLESRPGFHHLLALVPAAQLEAIAAWPEIRFIGPRQQAATSGPRPGLGPGLWGGLRGALRGALLGLAGASGGATAIDPEGDAAHGAALARGVFNVDGTGVTIGVLSNGIAHLADSQALGALGTVHVPTVGGVLQAGTGDEGTAMLEIVHALAPGATLWFATGTTSLLGMADNIRALRSAGCDIIVDDVSYFSESRFQDGQAGSVVSTSNGGALIQAVKEVVAGGALYFSSAGNDGNLDTGTAGVYEGDFNDGGAASGPLSGKGQVHLFAPGITYDTLTAASGPVVLTWAEPLGAAASDYDLYVLKDDGSTVVAASTNLQNGSSDPVESVSAPAAGSRLVVVKAGGQARYFNLSTNRGRLQYATRGASYGHNAAAAAFTVAASSAVTGAYPGTFTAASVVEPYSSDGPRRIFFAADGTALTPGDFSSTGGTVLAKPDLTAADEVTVSGVGGFTLPFKGTSAAAPHAAAIAALAKAAAPAAAPAVLRTALTSPALDIMGAGWDPDAGAGIVMAYPALEALGALAYANPVLGTPVTAEHPGNGDGILEIGEGGQVTVPLRNATSGPSATAITATLSAVTAGVTVASPTAAAYPDLAPGASASNAFLFTVGPTVDPAATALDFLLTVQYAGGASGSRQLPFSVALGTTQTLTHEVGASPGVLTGVTATTGSQDGRISRDSIVPTCASPKTYPGTANLGTSFAFDAYSFTACRSGCAQVQLTNTGSTVYLSVYSPGFDPTSVATGYLADAGVSQTTQTVGVQLVAGQTYTVVVNELRTGVTGDSYTLILPATFITCGTSNQPPVALAQDLALGADPVTGTASGSVDHGSYDPDGDAVTLRQAPAGPYPLGTTQVVLTATDPKGAMGQATAQVTVNPIPTTTTLASATGTYGATVLTARVGAAGHVPTGTVQFTEGAAVLGSAAVDGTGLAALAAPDLAAASHLVVARFTGSGGFGASASTATEVVVGAQATTVAVSSPGASPSGAELALTARVAGAYGTPTGSVTFFDGASPLASVALAGGTAVCRTSALAPGSHAITAAYAGDGNFAAAVSPAWTQAVTLSLALVPSTAQLAVHAGQGGSLQLSVRAAGALTGPVSFTCAGLPAGAQATFTPATLAPGSLPAEVTVTLAWTASAGLGPTWGNAPWPWLAAGTVLLAGSRRRRRGGFLAVLLLGAALAWTLACGGGGGGGSTAAGQRYDLTFTATTPDAAPATASVELDVNP
jgi:hypothetical protein